MNKAMVRGSLPLIWLGLFTAVVLVFDVFYTITQAPPTLPPSGLAPFFLLLALLLPILLIITTVLIVALGLPSKAELVATVISGLAGSAAIISLVALAGLDHVGWALVAVVVFIVPSHKYIFRKLMSRGQLKSPDIGEKE